VTPPLSVVHQPIAMLARHSVELVLERMQGKLTKGVRVIDAQPEFIPRSSCATLNKSSTKAATHRGA